MNDYGNRTGSERGSIEPRRQGFGSLWDFEPLRGFFPSNWQHTFGIDVNRRDDCYEIEMPVPGFKPQDVEINYQDGVLTVNGKNERRTFTRSLTVPDDVDEEGIEANVEHGMLVIVLRQHPKRQPKRITVGSSRETSATQAQQRTTSTQQTQQGTSSPGTTGTTGTTGTYETPASQSSRDVS